jgi:hypothetical protein
MYGNEGNDYVEGARGNDKEYPNNGADGFFGDMGNDSMYGGDDDEDYVEGEEGSDRLSGNYDDFIDGADEGSPGGRDLVDRGDGSGIAIANGNDTVGNCEEVVLR